MAWSEGISGFVVSVELVPIDSDVGILVGGSEIEGGIVVDVGIGVVIS